MKGATLGAMFCALGLFLIGCGNIATTELKTDVQLGASIPKDAILWVEAPIINHASHEDLERWKTVYEMIQQRFRAKGWTVTGDPARPHSHHVIFYGEMYFDVVHTTISHFKITIVDSSTGKVVISTSRDNPGVLDWQNQVTKVLNSATDEIAVGPESTPKLLTANEEAPTRAVQGTEAPRLAPSNQGSTQARLDSLKVGMTTSEILQLLGNPLVTRSEISAEGKVELWAYSRGGLIEKFDGGGAAFAHGFFGQFQHENKKEDDIILTISNGALKAIVGL